MADLRQLSGADPVDSGLIESRYILHPHHARAEAWLTEQFKDIGGLKVEHHPFFAMGRPLVNIVAKRKGRNRNAAPIIVAAHYDSIASFEPEGTWDGTKDPAPGADDDGSGVVAVLELARLFTQSEYRTTHPIWFVLFSGEEEGLIGSTAYAKQLAAAEQEVKLMLALDPIGFNPAQAFHLWFSYNSQWPEPADTFEQVALNRQGPLTLHGVDEALFGGDERSDHFPFWQNGYPALHLANFPLSPDFHTMDDTADDIDPYYLSSVTELVADLILETDGNSETQATCQMVPLKSWGVAVLGLVCLVIFRVRWKVSAQH